MPPQKPGRDRYSGGFVFVWLPWRKRNWKCGVDDYNIYVGKLRRDDDDDDNDPFGFFYRKDENNCPNPVSKIVMFMGNFEYENRLGLDLSKSSDSRGRSSCSWLKDDEERDKCDEDMETDSKF
ncbi:hypothetical protein J1N35_010733 [Gossypium stocksii]|uniref:Uncharacterized protein n=1 Tax=Gossypium stocksii TaxID=47602 RepID=A0A9D4ACS3_9ROSI|nr:hypothetical protein J1N35_010733 [Gossypium stocksii]